MSRRYITHLKSVTLMAPIESPETRLSATGFGHERFKFFQQEGWFCIESIKTGRVHDVPPAQIRERRWFTDGEIVEMARLAELDARKAKEAALSGADEALKLQS